MNIDPEAWNEYKKMRVKIRKPMTPYAEKLALRKLEAFYHAGFDVNAILDQSIFNSWQGLFEVKDETSGRVTSKSDQRKATATQQYIAGDVGGSVVAINRNGPPVRDRG